MSSFEAMDRLVDCLKKMPGIGRRTAERMAIRLVRERDGLFQDLLNALKSVEKTLTCCPKCGSITTQDRQPCSLCSGQGRDPSILCVVEDPDDIAMIERSGAYRGRYHALMGKISPMHGEGADNIRIKALLERIDAEKFSEIILALSTDVEGDATAAYLAGLIRGKKIRVSRLAFGLPAGSGIMYSDPVTLARAIKGRTVED